ncbi:MAG: hypothetical protein LJE92_04235 [Gammaproteobacteria bacterium]|jgi:hypothetical protein|nr:hypothetical protein [Gammaproteobacteria bacterium]
MHQVFSLRSLMVMLLTVLLAGCAATRSVMEWQDKAYSGKLNNILVIAAVDDNTMRHRVEDAYSEKFASMSLRATPGYTLIANDLPLSRETVETAIAGQHLDAVLVTRLLGVEEVEEYQPPGSIDYYRGYHRYYAHSMMVSSPGYYRKYKLLTLETNLYDTRTGKLVWSMQSESIDSSAPQKLIDEQIALTVARLQARGLLAPAA